MFWAFFYYFQNLAKSLGRFSLILDPFFERFPLSNTQKSPKIFARNFLVLFYFLQKISNFFGRSFIFYKKSPNVFGRSFSYGGFFNIRMFFFSQSFLLISVDFWISVQWKSPKLSYEKWKFPAKTFFHFQNDFSRWKNKSWEKNLIIISM